MPCNSGVSLTPVVNGKPEQFAARGLFNGLALLGDYTTNSYWDHITGECVYGPLQGAHLLVSPFALRYMSVSGALAASAHAQIAFSTGMPLRGRFLKAITPYMHRVLGNRLPPQFMRTLGVEDSRLARMNIGLGLWTPHTRRYYPLSTIRASASGILDRVDGESVFVYFDTAAAAPDAVYLSATHVRQHDGFYIFDTGFTLHGGKLFNTGGEAVVVKRPQQMFTRWYGFAFTFPGCEIYERGRQ